MLRGDVDAQSRFRLGGMVVKGSFNRPVGSLEARFEVTDGDAQLAVTTSRILPDMFAEGTAVVASGTCRTVSSSPTKCWPSTMKYVPKEVADKMGDAHRKHDVPVTAPRCAECCPNWVRSCCCVRCWPRCCRPALPLVGAHRNNAAWMAVARPAAFAQLLLLAGAFAVLTAAFVQQDFSVRYVAENSIRCCR